MRWMHMTPGEWIAWTLLAGLFATLARALGLT